MNKFKKIISTFLIFVLFFSWNSVVLADYQKILRWKSIDAFNKQLYENIFKWENVFLKEWVDFVWIRNEIVSIEQTLLEMQEETLKYEEQKNWLETRITNLEQALADIDKEVSEWELKIQTFSQDIASSAIEVNKAKKEIDELNQKILKNREVLFEYIIHIYKKQNVMSVDNWDIDWLKTIFVTNWNLWDLISQLNFTTILELAWQQLVEEYKWLTRDLFTKTVELKSKIKTLTVLRSKEKLEITLLSEKKSFREKLLDYSKWKQDLYWETLASIDRQKMQLRSQLAKLKYNLWAEKSNILTKYWCSNVDFSQSLDLNWEYKPEMSLNYYKDLLAKKETQTQEQIDKQTEEKNTCLKLWKILDVEMQLTQFSTQSLNPMAWPVAPVNGISAYYKDPSYYDSIWSQHNAIDIPTAQSTDIIAPADWYITYKRDPKDAWYAYVVLKHANNYITVYGHVSEILFSEYTYIKAWTVFARSGWAPWANWSGPMTTWAHLHFEVLKDGSYVDPLEYMDLTTLEVNNIPKVQKYMYKYLRDYKLKNGVDFAWDLNYSNEFKLEWETEIDRQKTLLNNFAVWWFNNWDMWVEEAVTAKIDPSFLMCIWMSETALGKNLKTPFNVWNVWNVDSGWTQEFDSPRTWVYVVAKALNNKYLWKYDKIKQLTRYWNADGQIYASSPYNWQNNMLRCLTALKKEYISDDYNFRMTEEQNFESLIEEKELTEDEKILETSLEEYK